MKRKSKQNERFSGILRIGTRLLKYPGSPRPERFKVVNKFIWRGERVFVLETWFKHKRRFSFDVVPEWAIREFYGPWVRGKK